jgi:hypothetical protein
VSLGKVGEDAICVVSKSKDIYCLFSEDYKCSGFDHDVLLSMSDEFYVDTPAVPEDKKDEIKRSRKLQTAKLSKDALSAKTEMEVQDLDDSWYDDEIQILEIAYPSGFYPTVERIKQEENYESVQKDVCMEEIKNEPCAPIKIDFLDRSIPRKSPKTTKNDNILQTPTSTSQSANSTPTPRLAISPIRNLCKQSTSGDSRHDKNSKDEGLRDTKHEHVKKRITLPKSPIVQEEKVSRKRKRSVESEDIKSPIETIVIHDSDSNDDQASSLKRSTLEERSTTHKVSHKKPHLLPSPTSDRDGDASSEPADTGTRKYVL